MPNPIVVSPETTAKKRWHRVSSYAFAAKTPVVPVLAAELAAAAMAFPLAFSPQGAGFRPVAVFGLVPEQNLFVAPDGRWLGGYVPAVLRSYPFHFATVPDGRTLLCVDADSGLLIDDHDGAGEAFFNADGTLSEALSPVVDFLGETANNVALTATASEALQSLRLIVPWDLTIQYDEGERKVDGLFKIDEAALNALPDDQFVSLRQNGALLVAYCQLLSMQRLSLLAQLGRAQTQAAAKAQAIRQATASGDIDLSSLTGGSRG